MFHIADVYHVYVFISDVIDPRACIKHYFLVNDRTPLGELGLFKIFSELELNAFFGFEFDFRIENLRLDFILSSACVKLDYV